MVHLGIKDKAAGISDPSNGLSAEIDPHRLEDEILKQSGAVCHYRRLMIAARAARELAEFKTELFINSEEDKRMEAARLKNGKAVRADCRRDLMKTAGYRTMKLREIHARKEEGDLEAMVRALEQKGRMLELYIQYRKAERGGL